MTQIPFFEDESSKRQPGFPTVERDTVNVLVWNPRMEEIICLDWIKFGWRTFIIGGIEPGEKAVETAMREVTEETGYTDLELVADLGQLQSAYFATHKKENRIANTTGMLFRLVSDIKQEVKNATDLPHIFKWIKRDEVADFLTLSSQKYLWDRAQPHLR